MKYADLAEELQESVKARRPALGEGLSLSDEQLAALRAPFDCSAVVTAGAGAGKTRLMVERACALVKAGADPQRVAVVTFTRKAAEEISSRMLARFGQKTKVPVCATVHSLALSSLLAMGEHPRIADERLILEIAQELQDQMPEDWHDLSVAEFLLRVNRSREEQDYTSDAAFAAAGLEARLAEDGLVDFTGLLEAALAKLKPRFSHILVDEAQDLSLLQRAVLKRMARPGCKFWYIGDADQAIYSFRGAQASVMDELRAETERHFVLTTNYRSARAIVTHANNVIAFNQDRLAIRWQAYRTDEGKVSVESFDTGADELSAVAEWLRKPGRMALARTQALVEPLREVGLPAMTVHESKGLEWPEVWLLGCEAAVFPHPLGERSEERRLFYVAMTRARDTLVMSYCRSRAARNPQKRLRHPSVFLYETQALEHKS